MFFSPQNACVSFLGDSLFPSLECRLHTLGLTAGLSLSLSRLNNSVQGSWDICPTEEWLTDESDCSAAPELVALREANGGRPCQEGPGGARPVCRVLLWALVVSARGGTVTCFQITLAGGE